MVKPPVKLSESKQVQSLQAELFRTTEPLQGDAWISDEAGTETLAEFFQFVEGHLAANREATKAITAFLRKHRQLRRASSIPSTLRETPEG